MIRVTPDGAMLGLRDWLVEKGIIMDEIGQVLYEIYLDQFDLVFAPRWKELSNLSKANWSEIGKKFLERQK